jgi:very-short-patch-repair endonuclease
MKKELGENNSLIKRNKRIMSYGEEWLHKIFLENKIYEKYDVVNEYAVYPYLIDFAFINEKVAVEFDGGFHFDKDGNRIISDIKRDKYLNLKYWRLYRIPHFSKEYFNINDLIDFIGDPERKNYQPDLVKYKQIKLEREEYKLKIKLIKRIISLLKKISKKKKQHNSYIGEKNSQYGTCWIYSLVENRSLKIKIEEKQEYFDMGYIKGRKMKFKK